MKKINGLHFRAQSAMEYLMTYGWAILIIAVVLGALFSLGLFSGSTLLGTSCVATPGWLCSSPILSHTTGQLSFTLGQNNGYQIANLTIACAAASNTLGLPVATTPNNIATYNGFYAVNAIGYAGVGSTTGKPAAGSTNGGTALASGATVGVTNLACYQSSGTPLGANLAIGTGFQGSLWVAFNSTGGTGVINTVSKVATISVKSS